MAESLNDSIAAMIGPLEDDRKSSYQKYKVFMLVGSPLLAIGVLFFALSLFSNWPDAFLGLFFVVIIVGVVLLVLAGIVRNNYDKKVLDSLKGLVDKTLFPNAKSDPNGGLSLKTVMAPGFFAQPDRYLASDYFSAVYDGIPFERARYRLQRRETHSDAKGHSYTTYEDYAVGTLYHFTYERDFGQVVKVLEKAGLFAFTKPSMKKVETEFILFNKKFLVLASDETTVFYLLTPQMQEKILDLEKKFKGQFYLAFMGNELFIAVNDSNSSVSIPWNKPLDMESVAPVVECLAIPAVFIKMLGLNQTKFEKNAGANFAK